MSDDLALEVRRLAPRLVAWRRSFHKRPELGFEERETASVIARALHDLDVDETITEIAGTGVVGVLRSGRDAPAVLLRADMDALPIQETSGREYGSEIPGRMHACGHDGHVAMLLGAATLLSARRDRLVRDVVLCFQPAEEGLGGAAKMIGEGILERFGVGEAYGLHLWTPFPVGTVHVRPGPTMAAQDEFTAVLRGRGGHGAEPHRCIDPIVAASQAVLAVQTIVSRSVDPLAPAVVTVGSLHAGSAPNVIPDEAVFHGTMRSFDDATRQRLRDRLAEALSGVASASGCRLDLDVRHGFPAVVNDPAAVARVRAAAVRVVGEAAVHEPAPLAAAEDFAYFLRRVPGAFAFVGAGNEASGITAPHHSPRFDIDEAALPVGAELLTRLALAG